MRTKRAPATRRLRLTAALTAAAVGGSVLAAVPPTVAQATSAVRYYLSLGDSLAEGYQPGFADESETLEGYSNDLVSDLASSHPLTLENYGCGGATTRDVLSFDGCTTGTLAADGVPYPTEPQLTAALDFIHAHEGEIGLITISLGGNDIYQNVPLSVMKANLQTISIRLRRAVGSAVPIIGINDYDTTLGDWLDGASGQAIATASVQTYQSSIDPAFVSAYAKAHVSVVNMAAAFGNFVPLSTEVNLSPYGTIPYAVAQMCSLTWVCVNGDHHATTAGYAFMANQIVVAYLHVLASTAKHRTSA